jgi:hypothetical protein
MPNQVYKILFGQKNPRKGGKMGENNCQNKICKQSCYVWKMFWIQKIYLYML